MKKAAITVKFPNILHPQIKNFHIDIVPARLLPDEKEIAWVYNWDLVSIIKSSVEMHVNATKIFK